MAVVSTDGPCTPVRRVKITADGRVGRGDGSSWLVPLHGPDTAAPFFSPTDGPARLSNRRPCSPCSTLTFKNNNNTRARSFAMQEAKRTQSKRKSPPIRDVCWPTISPVHICSSGQMIKHKARKRPIRFSFSLPGPAVAGCSWSSGTWPSKMNDGPTMCRSLRPVRIQTTIPSVRESPSGSISAPVIIMIEIYNSRPSITFFFLLGQHWLKVKGIRLLPQLLGGPLSSFTFRTENDLF